MIFSALGGTEGLRHTYGPNFLSLSQIPGMESPARTDALLISHGHYDHIGYLPDFAEMCPYTPVYATQVTKELGKHLMWDRFRYEKDMTVEKRMGEDYLIDCALQRIHGNGYGSPFTVGNVKITFYEAGHIPGAAMIYLESPEGNVLYTGDFMREKTTLTCGYQLPAKQLPKGLEMVRSLAQMMEKGAFPYEPIFAEEQIVMLAERLGSLNMQVLPQNCRPYDILQLHSPRRPKGIYVGGCFGPLPALEADFSLHADYEECRRLVEGWLPSALFVVHSPKDREGEGDTLLAEEFPNIQVIYPETGRVYGSPEGGRPQ